MIRPGPTPNVQRRGSVQASRVVRVTPETVTSEQISDATEDGRALLTAADVAAQKTLLDIAAVDDAALAAKAAATHTHTGTQSLCDTSACVGALMSSGVIDLQGLVDWIDANVHP